MTTLASADTSGHTPLSITVTDVELGQLESEVSSTRRREFAELEVYGGTGSSSTVNTYLKKVVEDAPVTGNDRQLLGTLTGVFFPVFANTLDAIIFLRMPWIVGQGGLIGGLGALAIPALVTILTALSLSAIATNGKVPAGGPYYLVTRALGPELGIVGAVFFYLCDTIYAGFCTIGATETLLRSLGLGLGSNMQLYGFGILGLMFILCLFGTRMVAMVTPFALAGVAAAALSVVAGAFTSDTDTMPGFSTSTLVDNASPKMEPGVTLITLIGLFFPCYSGVVSGAYRSGVLKDPSKSIPKGTVGGIFCVTLGYMFMLLAYGGSIIRSTLVDQSGDLASAQLAPAAWVVSVGTILCAVGAALQGLSGTPFLLVAISKEKNIPLAAGFQKLFSLGKKHAPDSDESRNNADETSSDDPPFMALLFTFMVASIPIIIGSVDLVAPVVTMSFCIVYGLLNLSCFINAALKQPNWRPRWKYFSWWSALLGLIGCGALTIMINPTVASGILVFGFSLYKYIQYKHVEANWGDGLTGLRYQSALDALLQVPLEPHVRNWRPQVLAIINPLGGEEGQEVRADPGDIDVMRFIGQLKTGHGLTLVATCTSGSFIKTKLITKTAKERRSQLHLISSAMRKYGVEGFPVCIAADSHRAGLASLLQCAGLGGMTPNTVVISWQDSWVSQLSSAREFFDLVEECNALEKAVIVVKGTFPDTVLNPWGKRHKAQLKEQNAEAPYGAISPTPASPLTQPHTVDAPVKLGAGKEIHIWWIIHDGGLLLLLAHLLKNSKTWKGSIVRIFTVARLVDNSVQMKKDIQKFLYEARITVQSIEVVELEEGAMHEYTTMRTLMLEERRALLKDVQRAKDLTMIGAAHTGHSTTVPATPHAKDMNVMVSSAVRLNDLMKKHSSKAELLLLNLPTPTSTHMDCFMYASYVQELTGELPRALLIKGSSHEVISSFE